MARTILQCISAVVKSYHADQTDGLGIRANLTLIRPCTPENQFTQRLSFVLDAERATVRQCLQSAVYDVNENRSGIFLPLFDDEGRTLPGAPTALGHPDGLAIIGDTANIVFTAATPDAVREAVKAYFRGKLFKSFASMRVVGRGQPIGVVNIEARVKDVFGNSAEENRRIARYLLPFCSALGMIYVDVN
jgi:hypothetical protein